MIPLFKYYTLMTNFKKKTTFVEKKNKKTN